MWNQNETLNEGNFVELKSQILKKRAEFVKKVKDDILNKQLEQENAELKKIFFRI